MLAARLFPRTIAAGTRFASTAVKTRPAKGKKPAARPEVKSRVIPTTSEKPSLVETVKQAASSVLNATASTLSTDRASTAPPSAPMAPQPKIPGNPELPVVPTLEFLDVKIPRPSDTIEPEMQVQIPFVPDFWDSSTVFPDPEPEADTLPKLVVVGGDSTHHGGGPSHNLLDMETLGNGDSTTQAKTEKYERTDSFVDDITDDLGLPPAKQIKDSFWKMFS